MTPSKIERAEGGVQSQSTDWYDSRLKQAYELIDAVLDSSICAQDHLRKAAEAVEDADLALEQGA
jgi:hypothetical protein